MSVEEMEARIKELENLLEFSKNNYIVSNNMNVKLRSQLNDIEEYVKEAYEDASTDVKKFITDFCDNFDISLEQEYEVSLDVTVQMIVVGPMGYNFSPHDFDVDVEVNDYRNTDNISIESVDININDVDYRER
jgi:hypothetical protein